MRRAPAVGEEREALFAVTIPEQLGAFLESSRSHTCVSIGQDRSQPRCGAWQPLALHGRHNVVDALDDVLRVLASLNESGVDYVIVGGVAMNFHGLIRATEDLDLFVRPDPENIERLRRALRAVWADPDIEQITAEDLCGDYPVVRYGPPQGSLYLDILTRLGEATAFADLEAQEIEINGVTARVATPRTLYRMKKGTVRAIDHADANALQIAFALSDEDQG